MKYRQFVYLYCNLFALDLIKTCQSLSPLWDSVQTNILQEYDVKQGNEILTVRIDMGEYKTTDLVIGQDVRKDSRLIMTCIAHHGPAEWVYSGDGNPQFTTNTTIENIPVSKRIPTDDTNGAKRYIATLTLGQPRITSTSTGRYNCLTTSPDSEDETQYKTLSAFYHVYVPVKNKLFNRKSETVYYDLAKSAARIPCGVNNPKASVTLQKFVKGNLEFIPNDGMLFHPISGYYPKKNIKGTYLCTAAYESTFDFVYFTLLPKPTADNKKNTRKPNNQKVSTINRFTKPEDLEWLMYPTTITQLVTKRPKPTPSTLIATTKRSTIINSKPTSRTSYIPFHLRYNSTTYGPFQTFFDVQTTTTSTQIPQIDDDRYTIKTKPFNPSNYPSELFGTTTRRSTSSNNHQHEPESLDNDFEIPFDIPIELISYRPVINQLKQTSHLKDSSSSNNFNRPVIIKERRTTPIPMRNTRTTPRKYHTFTMPTTELPFVIPERIVCSQFSCGKNAVCYANLTFNHTLQVLQPEPGCKCLANYIGNPYLECYTISEMMDPNVLFFNPSSYRNPELKEPVYSESDSESENESLLYDRGSRSETTSEVDVIDM